MKNQTHIEFYLRYIPDGSEFSFPAVIVPGETIRRSLKICLYNLGNRLKSMGRVDIVKSPDSDCETKITCSRDIFDTLMDAKIPNGSKDGVPTIDNFPLVVVDCPPEDVPHPNAKRLS